MPHMGMIVEETQPFFFLGAVVAGAFGVTAPFTLFAAATVVVGPTTGGRVVVVSTTGTSVVVVVGATVVVVVGAGATVVGVGATVVVVTGGRRSSSSSFFLPFGGTTATLLGLLVTDPTMETIQQREPAAGTTGRVARWRPFSSFTMLPLSSTMLVSIGAFTPPDRRAQSMR